MMMQLRANIFVCICHIVTLYSAGGGVPFAYTHTMLRSFSIKIYKWNLDNETKL